jgi:formiminotetrahydrofolate cyclodeaminase
MTISSIPHKIQELKKQLEALISKHEMNEDMIKQIIEDMDEITDIVTEHAQQEAETYTASSLDTKLPKPTTDKKVSIPQILDKMYKLN